jgi:hypothetical protein
MNLVSDIGGELVDRGCLRLTAEKNVLTKGGKSNMCQEKIPKFNIILSKPSGIRTMKSLTVRWGGHVCERLEAHTRFWLKNRRERTCKR